MFDTCSYIFLIVFGITFIASIVYGIYDYKRCKQNRFPDERFTRTCKKYSTKEIATAFDDLADGI